MEWLPCPLSTGLLERYRLKIGHHHRPDLVGGHLMRRKGSSLEFHEFSPYAPGDDIRRVDWQASLRTGEDDAWLIRRFTAEERTTLLISLDLSPSMHLPEGFSKVQIACWLAESLATVGLHYGDRVIFHRLFGTPQNGLMELKTPNLRVMRSQLRKLASYSGDPVPFNACSLDRMLPPASIWIVISDLYFEKEAAARKLARTMSFAQAGLRWLIVADLNAWPMERNLLGLGERRLTGPNHSDPNRLYNITAAHLDEVERKINSHKNHFRKQVSQTACDFTRWSWPKASDASASDFFRKQFLSDRLLQRMFMRES